MKTIKGRSIKKNFIYQSAYQILTIIYPMITAPYISRVFGAEGVGVYSYTYSIVYYFVIFAKLGIETYGNREIATVRDNQKKLNQSFSDLYAIHFTISVISLLAYLAYVLMLAKQYRLIALIQGFYILGELLNINWFFWGIEQFKITVLRNTFIKTISLILIFVLVHDSGDLWKYVLLLALGSVVSESIIWFTLHRFVKPVMPDWKRAKKHIAPLFVFFLPAIAVSLYKYMDKIMLGLLSDTTQVGYFENSEKIVNIALGLISSLGVVMMPRMSNMVATGNTKESNRYITISMKFIMILSLAMMFGIVGVSSVFPRVFFGEEFMDCSVLLCGLAISLPFTAFANVIRTQYLIPNHHDKIYVISLFAGASVNLVINYLLIRKYQAFGAVIGTICAECIVCIIQSVYASIKLPILRYIKTCIPYLVFGTIMAGIVRIIGRLFTPNALCLFIEIVVGIIIYIGLVVSYMYLVKDADLLQLLSKLKRKNER